MGWLYRNIARRVLFTQEPESIHHRTLTALGWLGRNEVISGAVADFLAPRPLPVDAFGLQFPNPIGLAAGMDKNAEAVPAWEALGFGFVELGAVTRYGQPGNDRPRVFRAIAEEAIINRMGFNNPGAETVAGNLARWRASGRWPRHPVGVNLGKSKIVPLEEAPEDYAVTFRTLWQHADFFVVNVSSPNTPNLRKLQDKAALDAILAALQEVNHALGSARGAGTPGGKPILVKVAPDLTFEALDEILELTEPREVAGIVATNTTITRPAVNDPAVRKVYAEAGGLSGRPLRARSTEVIRHLFRRTRGRVSIMGVGGVFDAEDAWEKVVAGAALLQIYTSLVYEGPGVTRAIVNGLRRKLEEVGFAELQQAVGTGAS